MARVLAERYELRRRLAVGGMAEVYEAHDTRLGRAVAVKVLRTDLPDPRARDRFEHEARVAAVLHHPNVVTVYDVGEEGTRPFIVMELVDGDDLADHLARSGPRSVPEAVRILDGVLRALEAAHAHGIVHRDVKPGNVLLGRDGRPRLADFGIAKAMAAATTDLTQAGQVIGTPRYLSPEQRRGEAATPRSDLYAAGMVLYEVLTGAAPTVDDTLLAGTAGAGRPALPPVRLRRPELSPALAAVVDRAVAFEPADRFADAASMRAALVAAAAGTAPWPVVEAPAAVAAGDRTAVLSATAVAPLVAPAAARAAAPPRATPAPAPATFGGARPTHRRHLTTVGLCAGLALVVAGLLFGSLLRPGASSGGMAPTVPPTQATAAPTTPATAAPTTRPAPTTTVARSTTTVAATTSSTRPATTTTTVARTTTTRAATTTTAAADPPGSVDELIAVLSRDTASYGDRAATLLGDLRAIRDINPKRKGGEDLRNAAAAELDKVSRWRDEGSLDEDAAGWAEDVLRPLAS